MRTVGLVFKPKDKASEHKLDKMTVAELKAQALERNIDLLGAAKKEVIIERIEAAQMTDE